MNETQKAEVAAFIRTDAFAALKEKVLKMTSTPVREDMQNADVINIRLAIDRGVMLAFEAIEAAIRPHSEKKSPPEIGRLNKRKLMQ